MKMWRPIKLTFDILPTGNIGTLISSSENGKLMVFPQCDFNPEIGKPYMCYLRMTMFGKWIDGINNKEYRTAHARPSEEQEASIGDVWKFEDDQKVAVELAKISGSPFAALADIKSKLPEKYDLVDLVVDVDRNDRLKNGGYMFRPQYLNNDSEAGGNDSMRFFHATNANEMEWALGKCYTGRIEKIIATGKNNARGAFILNVYVKVAEEKRSISEATKRKDVALLKSREQSWFHM